MRTLKRVLDTAVADQSPWVRINNMKEDYSIGLRFHPHDGATGTYSIQNSLSNPEEFRRAKFTRSGTTLSIELEDHGLTAADAISLQGTDWDNVEGFTIEVASVVDGDNFTVTVANSGTTSGSCQVSTIIVEDFDDFSGVSGRTKGSTTGAVQLIRAVKGAGSFSGKGTLQVTQSY